MAGGGGNAPPTPPGTTTVIPAVSWALRRRLKSMMTCRSTWYVAPRLSNVSVALVVTTMPGTGGMTICCPVATESLAIRFVFDQRIWLTVTPYLAAIAAKFSPAATAYVMGMRLMGAEVGIETGLMIVLYRPSDTSPTVPPSLTTTASAFTAPKRAVREEGKWRSIVA